MNITAHQIEMAVKEAHEFNLEETLNGCYKTLDKQFKRGLIDEWEVESRKQSLKEFYTKQQEQANEIIELVNGYKK